MTTNQFDLTILNKEVKNGGLFFGSRTIIKEIKKGNISKIYLSNDILAVIQKDIEKEAKTSNLPVIIADLDKEHLKEICKKPFNISVLGIQKGSEASRNKDEEKEDSRKEIRAKKDLLQKEKKRLEDQEEKVEERKKRTEKEEKPKKEKSKKKEEKK